MAHVRHSNTRSDDVSLASRATRPPHSLTAPTNRSRLVTPPLPSITVSSGWPSAEPSVELKPKSVLLLQPFLFFLLLLFFELLFRMYFSPAQAWSPLCVRVACCTRMTKSFVDGCIADESFRIDSTDTSITCVAGASSGQITHTMAWQTCKFNRPP